jgi:hypothetical protein
MLADRLALLIDDVEHASHEATQSARQDCANQINQALRRMGQAANYADLADTLADAAAHFSGGAAVMSIAGGMATLESVRPGVDARAGAGKQTSIEEAPALRAAIESREPVIAAVTESEIGGTLATLAPSAGNERVAIFPVAGHAAVPALVCAWGTVEAAGIEILAQVAAEEWDRVARAAAQAAADAAAAAAAIEKAAAEESSWDNLSAAEKRIHLRARRFARVRVARWRLGDGTMVRAGRARGDLYGELKAQIDEARDGFHKEFIAGCPSMLDYLHLEMVHTLAHDDAELLGKDYPGPLL